MSHKRIDALAALFEGRKDRFVTDLGELVKRESPSDDAARVTALASWIALRMGGAGVETRTLPCAGRGHALLAQSFRPPTREPGFADERPTEGGTLLLGHLDTVWPMGTFSQMPFKVTDGVATGPGVFDMKGGIAVAIGLMSAIAQGEVSPKAPVALLLVPDEEIGSGASRELLVAEAMKRDRVLVLEPSAENGAAKIARKGIGLVEATFHGIASHAGLEPEKGASALAELARFVLFAISLADAENGTSVVPTTASAGTKTNVVPEEARVTVDYRLWTAAEGERVTAALLGYVPADPRVTVTLTGGVNRPAMEPTEDSLALYDRLGSYAARLGFALPAARVGGASDGNLTASAGVTTMDGLGPNGGGAHARSERVFVDDLPRRAALLAALLEDAPLDDVVPLSLDTGQFRAVPRPSLLRGSEDAPPPASQEPRPGEVVAEVGPAPSDETPAA